MRAIVSSTHDDKYLFFLPIITWCWNKLGVDVICFMRMPATFAGKGILLEKVREEYSLRFSLVPFECLEHKEATYAQCSRLYAGSLGLPDDEVLISSDIDMAVFKIPEIWEPEGFVVTGFDLVPPEQYPMCYISASVKYWRMVFGDDPVQKQLDDLLGGIECESFRGNYWGKDQEQAFKRISEYGQTGTMQFNNRARPGTQFAENRVDRDDINWRSYLGPDLMDAHLWRPGYSDENFPKILELLQTQYPEENFQWLINYRNEYIKLI